MHNAAPKCILARTNHKTTRTLSPPKQTRIPHENKHDKTMPTCNNFNHDSFASRLKRHLREMGAELCCNLIPLRGFMLGPCNLQIWVP